MRLCEQSCLGCPVAVTSAFTEDMHYDAVEGLAAVTEERPAAELSAMNELERRAALAATGKFAEGTIGTIGTIYAARAFGKIKRGNCSNYR